MVFKLDEKELTEYRKWIEEHDKTCPHADPMKQGAIGGRLTYTFTPTSLGVITIVKCACGEEINLTDTDSW